MRRRRRTAIGAALVGLAAVVAAVAWLNVRGEAPLAPDATPAVAPSPELVARGAYLARAGNCIGCHAGGPGGSDLSGGHGIETPFGTVHASNLTPDPATGIGEVSTPPMVGAAAPGVSARPFGATLGDDRPADGSRRDAPLE